MSYLKLTARLPLALFAFYALSVFPSSAAAASKTSAAKPAAAHKAAQQTLQDGIYKVTFSAPDGHNGVGIIVISGGAVNGGDPAYTYQGRVDAEGDKLNAVIDVVRYNPKEVSIFGPLDQFQVHFTGTLQQDGTAFIASGEAAPDPKKIRLSLSGERLKELRR
ncbi:GrlR family regulatory protein [Candidatus Electronema sp. JM]|uniref:GrlR family regulatory protein n=1 Tax=Candidatus Electronema sp. JM TaxID=3401571 RepID=UPI003AA7F20C